MFGKIHISTIELSKRRFQTSLDISLHEKRKCMSHRAQNKTFIKEASPGISYYTLDKNAYGQRWNIAFHERSVSNMKVETVTFVMKGIVKLTAPF